MKYGYDMTFELNLSSLPVWEVWIEIAVQCVGSGGDVSLPVWEVWIEILYTEMNVQRREVTSRLGSVD